MKIVQIGTGGWGKNHVRVLSQLGVLCAVCDTNQDRSAEFGSKYDVNHYTSIDNLFASEEFDCAVVATPTVTHAQIVKRLLEAKKHVFVEKPLTYKVEDGIMLAELAKKNKVVLTCGYIERFNPAVSIVREVVTNQKYGDLIMLEFHRENHMPLHIMDVGIIYDTTVHDIDTANWLLGEMPHVVFARAGSIKHKYEDFATIMLGYSGDRVAIISSNWITPKRVRKFGAVFTKAVISSNFITQEVTVDDGREGGTINIEHERQEPLLLELSEFVEATREEKDKGRPPRVTPQEAINVTRIAEAALLSSKKGIPIYLDLK